MSAAMDRAMMAMSIEEEDKPLVIPNRPEYSSCASNALSLIGRILNPDFQKVPHLISEMPRKWQNQGKIRGVALNKERFQFFFNCEADLFDTLERGVQSYNYWAFALERWVEKEPADFLQFIPLWVQLRNLPVNYYRSQTVCDIGEILGVVKEIAFDNTKTQSQPYVRVKVMFNVAHPLRKSKMIVLPTGEEVCVEFFYEKIQMRCYNCQRLNHDKTNCPLLIKVRQDQASARKMKVQAELKEANLILKKSDPLFGVLKEDQVGFNQATGRLKIDPEVLEEMRRYLITCNGDDLAVKQERVKSSIAEVERDPRAQKTILRLEESPLITSEVDKGKGRVFDFEASLPVKDLVYGENLLEEARLGENARLKLLGFEDLRAKLESIKALKRECFTSQGFTENGAGLSEAGSSGARVMKGKSRKRQVKRLRKMNQSKDVSVGPSSEFKRHGKGVLGPKRKLIVQAESRTNISRRKNQKVIPHEGSPDI